MRLKQGNQTAQHTYCCQTRAHARLAQSAERKALNLVVVGSSPTVGGLMPLAEDMGM